MGIARYLSKLASGLSSEGVVSAAKGGTGSVNGGGSSNSPTISGISYTGDDTATIPAGGATVTLTGTNFAVGAKVLVNGVQPSSVTRVSATQITFPAPANAVGTYLLYVVNPDGSAAILVPGIQYSNTPSWTTAAGSLGSVVQQVSFSASVVATGDAPITYSVASGALPTGLTLNSSTGAITGTAPAVASSTTYNFTIRSTDAQNQDTDQAFSITVVPSNAPPTVEYLVVAGGGGSTSTSDAGGGGGGGYRTATGYAVTAATPITVVVGAGGTSGGTTRASDSSFGTITSIGGGQGATASSSTGINGGSGGGHGPARSGQYRNAADLYGGTGTVGQGNNGASYTGPWVTNNGNLSGGGGGGAGAAGSPGGYLNQTGSPAITGGAGGNGLQSSISGTATYYAGGGGGAGAGSFDSNNGGLGGLGGGGNGGQAGWGQYGRGSNGSANTGGGGGGNYAGGSGIVIIRYPDTYDAATATTGSPTVTVSGGYRIYKWTSSGSITF